MIVPQKSFDTNDKFQVFLETEKEWMYNRIHEAINDAFKSGTDTAFIMEAKIADTMTVMTINSDVSEWVDSLTLSIEWYVESEMYERCAKIRDLITAIETAEL